MLLQTNCVERFEHQGIELMASTKNIAKHIKKCVWHCDLSIRPKLPTRENCQKSFVAKKGT